MGDAVRETIEQALRAKATLEERAAEMLAGAGAIGNSVIALCAAHQLPVPDRALGFGWMDRILEGFKKSAAQYVEGQRALEANRPRAVNLPAPPSASAADYVLTPGQQRVRRVASLTPEQRAEKCRFYATNQARRKRGFANLDWTEYQRRKAAGEVVSSDGPRNRGGRPRKARGPTAKKATRRRR